MSGSAAISLVNPGLEGSARRGTRTEGGRYSGERRQPPWVKETLIALKMDAAPGMPAEDVAKAYAQSVDGSAIRQVIDARKAVW